MLRVIGEVQPRFVVGENVGGLVNWDGGMVFEQVQTDLEATGYESAAFILPACGVNAPHRRDRIWFIAHANGNGDWNIRKPDREENSLPELNRKAVHAREFIGADTRFDSDTFRNGQQQPHSATQINASRFREGMEEGYESDASNGNGDAAYSNNQGLQGSAIIGGFRGIGAIRNEQLTGFLRTDWEVFPTQSPVCGRDDVVSNRVDRIKSLGNAVVPALVYEIFKAIEKTST